MRITRYLLLIIIAFSLSFCTHKYDKCDDCNSYASVSFRVVSATDGKDLVFGPTRTYDKSRFKFYSLKGADTSFFDFWFHSSRHPDSTISVALDPEVTTGYLRLSDGDIDTFKISHQSFNACCGTITHVSAIQVNSLAAIPVPSTDTVLILKK